MDNLPKGRGLSVVRVFVGIKAENEIVLDYKFRGKVKQG